MIQAAPNQPVSKTMALQNLLGLGCLALLLVAGCRPQEAESPTEATNPMLVEATVEDFGDNPALLERILASPHGYLRFSAQYLPQDLAALQELSGLAQA